MDYCIALSDKYNMIIVQHLLGWYYIWNYSSNEVAKQLCPFGRQFMK